jgi:hypothetical protein
MANGIRELPRSWAGAVTVQHGDVNPALLKQVRTEDLSFETGEQGAVRVYFPQKATVTRVRYFVTKALAATDAGTVEVKNNAGVTMTGGSTTLPASASWGYETTLTPTGNNVVAADSYILLTTSKPTAGGRVRAAVEYVLTA